MDVHAFLLLLLHAFIFSATSSIAAVDNSTDLSSLLAFKASTSDQASGLIAANWTTDASFCTWIGVGCGRQYPPRVVSLNLSSFSLQGTISPHLSNLSFVSSLDLSNNSLSGTIPHTLGWLPRLATLRLRGNQLSGPIPRSIFNMSSLVSIRLSFNNLSSSLPTPAILPRIEDISISYNLLTGHIPADLAGCLTLQWIDLGKNKLIGSIPSSLGNLSELVYLSLGQNQLTGAIPDSISNLTKLRVLFLGFNDLEGKIPKELGNLVNLQKLYLHDNGIAGSIPISLWNASKMIILEVSTNNLTGPVPATLGKSMPFLQILLLIENALSGGLDFIASLTNCRDLKTIDVMGNQFEGVLPNAYGNLSMNLQYFHASDNNIKGRIPVGLGNLSSLISLSLSFNELRGTIPRTLWRLKKLQVMYLGFNRLTGSIPSDIGLMTNLATMSFPKNKLSGKIPGSVGNISGLQILYLSENKLSTIPLSLWSLTGLVHLNLYQNRFEGSLPPQMANLKTISYIDLWSNRLSGNISSALGELQSITYLDLSNNLFHDQIPQQLGRLFNVEYLNLSHNFLSGVIPKSFSNLPYVNSLDLSFNMLEGEIPAGKVFSNVSITSLMGNRALCGAPQLKFPPCPANVTTSTSSAKLGLVKYVLPSIASSSVFLTCFYLFVKIIMRKKVKASSKEESPCLNYHRRISYFELARATDNFNEANLLGRGSIGKVYKGSLDDGLVVAVKVLNLEVEGASRSFDAECRTLGHVRHRNLVKIISSCSNLEFKALVLEFMPNLSLDKWLYSENHFLLTLLQRINIMLDVSLGLDYLHHQHPHVIVHCDVKPSNILLDKNMVAKISDFGIAKLMPIDNKSTTPTNNIGTVGYMAPEYGSTGGATIMGDVYSFGNMMLELVTGKKPVDAMFSGELNLRQWVCNAYPTALMEIVDNNILRTEFTNLQQYYSDEVNILRRCLSSIIEVGLHCSKDLPNERLLMRDVVPRLQEIKNGVLVN